MQDYKLPLFLTFKHLIFYILRKMTCVFHIQTSVDAHEVYLYRSMTLGHMTSRHRNMKLKESAE